MLPLYALPGVSDSGLWTIWLVVWSLVGICWLLDWIIGKAHR